MDDLNWLEYWKKSLQYADIKPLDISNEPIKSDQFFLERIPEPLARQLWQQANPPKHVSKIEVALCPAQSPVAYQEQHGDEQSECLFWIIAEMDEDGHLSVTKDSYSKQNPLPFFVRDYLHPNPADFYALANVGDVDRALSEGKFSADSWSNHWADCEHLFEAVTGQDFTDFNQFDACYIYAELAPTRMISRRILELYEMIESDRPEQPLLNSLMDMQVANKQAYPDAVSVWQNACHVGQFSGQFPLAHSQRVSMRAFTDSNVGEVIAVNGPPGTGKTTLLQSIVANLVVQSVLDEAPPPLILASSTNNQAITNILSGFALPDSGDLLTERWLPDLPSLGLYLSSRGRSAFAMMDIGARKRTTGFFADYEQRSREELERYFLARCEAYFGREIQDVAVAKKCLYEAVMQQIEQASNFLNDAVSCSASLEALEVAGFSCVEALDDALLAVNDELAQLDAGISKWETLEAGLHQAYRDLPWWVRWFGFLGKSKAYRKLRYRKVVAQVDDGSLAVDDWSNHRHIIDGIDRHLIDVYQAQNAAKKRHDELETLQIAWHKHREVWQNRLDRWDEEYGSKLEALYRHTGDEYRGLDTVADANIRLDISFRFKAFWLALHFREADYLQRLAQRAGKTDAEYGEDTHVEKYRRFACLMPIFIATFHSAPKYARYFKKEDYVSYGLFDYLIVDEAGQVAPEVAIPTFALAKSALVVGDTQQIEPVRSVSEAMDMVNYHHHIAEPTGDSSEATQIRYQEQGRLCGSGSLMKMAQTACRYQQSSQGTAIDGLMLTEHRRCLNQLISYSNDYVYSGLLEPKRGTKPAVELAMVPGNKCYVHVPYSSERKGHSHINRFEGLALATWLKKHATTLCKQYDKPIEDIVAVVTPYKPQATLIKSELKRHNSDFSHITVGTVHALQGAERPVVLFSLVADPSDSLSFLNQQHNMLNVSISRARDYFVLFANMNTFANVQQNTPLGHLSQWLHANPDAEIDSSFIYDRLAEVATDGKQCYGGEVLRHVSTLEGHDSVLREACEQAESELLIVSPFLSIRAISSALTAQLSDAVARGVRLHVYCDTRLDMKNGVRKDNAKEAIAHLLSLGVKVLMVDGIHSKTIVFDRKDGYVMAEGSFNWLSAVRDPNSPWHRYEATVVLRGKEAEHNATQFKKFLENHAKACRATGDISK